MSEHKRNKRLQRLAPGYNPHTHSLEFMCLILMPLKQFGSLLCDTNNRELVDITKGETKHRQIPLIPWRFNNGGYTFGFSYCSYFSYCGFSFKDGAVFVTQCWEQGDIIKSYAAKKTNCKIISHAFSCKTQSQLPCPQLWACKHYSLHFISAHFEPDLQMKWFR